MKSAVMAFIFLGVCLPWCSAGIAAEPVSIEVVVTNETGGPAPAADAEVVLTVYQDGKPFQRKEGRSNERGVCLFEAVPVGKGRVAAATAKHQEMMFASRSMALEHAHEKSYQLPISVYDVSDDTSVLSIGTHHFVLRVEPRGIFVDEYLQIINRSDRAVTAAEKTPDGRPMVLKVFLPDGFEEVKCSRYFEEHALVHTKDGFIDTMAVPPGRHDAVFTYALKPAADPVVITKKAGLPTADFMVFSQLSGASLEGLGQPIGQMVIDNGKQADYFASVPLEAGGNVSFSITGLAVATDQNDLWMMFGVIFGLIVLVGAIRLFASKKQPASNGPDAVS